jgi:chemotaxis protein MotB
MKFSSGIPLFALALIWSLQACVPARSLEESKEREKKCTDELNAVKSEAINVKTKLTEFEEENTQIKKRISSLQNDTMVLGKTLRLMSSNYDKLNQTYELLLAKNRDIMKENSEDNKKLMTNLQLSQEQLQLEQDALKLLKTDLEGKKKALDETSKALEQTKEELAIREKKVNELQQILSSKDSTVNALKKKVSGALMGFENNGLTVEKKNGKVYVSLEERLLFASGSTTVDPKGVEALKSLGKVLEQNPDINILIEGHTDNVPYTGTGLIKDNWDLSVLRATSIVKILLSNSKIDPKRLMASGRGEFFPLDPANNAEARKKNRRTEIILTPKLDEILKVLETN